MINVKQTADEADFIINGYAFKKKGAVIQTINLNIPDKVSVFDNDGNLLETDMNDIEIEIVKRYLIENKEFMEEENA